MSKYYIQLVTDPADDGPVDGTYLGPLGFGGLAIKEYRVVPEKEADSESIPIPEATSYPEALVLAARVMAEKAVYAVLGSQ